MPTDLELWQQKHGSKLRAAGKVCLVCGTDEPRHWVKDGRCWACKKMGLTPADPVPSC